MHCWRPYIPAWPDAVDADVVRRERQRHAAGQVVYAALGRVVAGDRRYGHDGVDGRHRDDSAAAALRNHLARRRLARQERPLQVDRDNGVKVLLRHLEEVGGLDYACAVDKLRED